MKWVFWISLAVVLYTYLGYPAWLWVRARLRPRPIQRSSYVPSISIVMIVRDERVTLRRKLDNLFSLSYPTQMLELIVASDGSTDGTEEILNSYSKDKRLRIILLSQSRGKAACLNDAMRAAKGEIVVFTDARQEIEEDAIRLLMENFADVRVGCASGELMLGDRLSGEAGEGMGLYWRIEKSIRELESRSGSVVGATGALYAIRRELITPLPVGTILDDVYLPMNVVRRGMLVLFDARARAWDARNLGRQREFARKVRTLGGNYQLLQLAPWLLGNSNSIRFEFVSHKLMRLVIPFALIGLLAALFCHGTVYKFAAWTQVGFYLLGALSLARLKLGWLGRFANAASTFMVLNAAAFMAFTNLVMGRKVLWTPVSIPASGPSRQGVQS